MEKKYTTQEENYPAVERALSIVLCELGLKDTERVGLTRYQTTYTIMVPQHFLHTASPVLAKYINVNSIEHCIKNAQKVALARKVRGWSWWSFGAVFACLPCYCIHAIFYFIVLLSVLSVISIVFLSRKIVGKIWKNRSNSPEAEVIALEEMIQLCKKNSLQICIDYLRNR